MKEIKVISKNCLCEHTEIYNEESKLSYVEALKNVSLIANNWSDLHRNCKNKKR